MDASNPKVISYIATKYKYSKIGNFVVLVGVPDKPIFTFAIDISDELHICEIWNFKRHESTDALKGKTTSCMMEILRRHGILDNYNIWLGVVEPKLIPGYEKNGFRRIDRYEGTGYSPLGNTIGSPMISMAYFKPHGFPIKFLSNHYPSDKKIPIIIDLPSSIVTDIVKHLYNETDSEKMYLFYTTSFRGRVDIRSQITWNPTYFKLDDSLEMFVEGRKIDATSDHYKVRMYSEYVPRNSKYISGHSHPLSVYAAHSVGGNFVLIQPPSTQDILVFIHNKSEVNFVFTLEGVYIVSVNLSAIPTILQPEVDYIKSTYQQVYNGLFEHGKSSLQYYMHFLARHGMDDEVNKSKLSALRARDVTLFCDHVNTIKPDLFTVQFYTFNKLNDDAYHSGPFICHVSNIGDKIHITEDEYNRFIATKPDKEIMVHKDTYDKVAADFKKFVSPLSNEDFSNIPSVNAEFQGLLAAASGGGSVSGGGMSATAVTSGAVVQLPQFVKGQIYDLTKNEYDILIARGYTLMPAGGAGPRGSLYIYTGPTRGGGRKMARKHRKTNARKQHKRIQNTRRKNQI